MESLIICTLFICNLSIKSASASEYFITNYTQITNDTYNDNNPHSNNNNELVWSKQLSTDAEIYTLLSGQETPQQITSNEGSNHVPRISDQGMIVYYNVSGKRARYFTDGQSYNIVNVISAFPDINSNNQIAYMGYISGANNFDIYIKDNKRLTSNVNPDYKPSINSNSDVAWELWDYMYDRTDGCEIYLYNNEYDSVYRITNNSICDTVPNLNDNGQIVWYGKSLSAGDDYEIYLYDYQIDSGGNLNGSLTQITDNEFDDFYPIINNNGDIVWFAYDSDEGDRELFLYRDGLIHQITDNQVDDKNPFINDNGLIVWSQYDAIDGDYEILAGYAEKPISEPSTLLLFSLLIASFCRFKRFYR